MDSVNVPSPLYSGLYSVRAYEVPSDMNPSYMRICNFPSSHLYRFVLMQRGVPAVTAGAGYAAWHVASDRNSADM